MLTSPWIEIEALAVNPAHYLACCGIFEIAARIDKGARAWWKSGPAGFVLETETDEASITRMIVDALTSEDCWHTVAGANNPNAVAHIKFEMATGEETRTVFCFDWWYETFDGGYEQVRKEGKQFRNSAWKMYAGNQGISYYFRKARVGCQAVKSSVSNSLSSLLMARYKKEEVAKASGNEEVSGQGFGFDPRTARNALSVGYSFDKVGEGVARYPFADFLATIGLQSFFPHRTHEAQGLRSTRGWLREERLRFFRYGIWREPVPILVAKILAAGTNEAHFAFDVVRSLRANRDNYSNLTYAAPSE